MGERTNIRLERTNIASGVAWEEIVGYSRAVRVGPFVYVTGTIAVNDQGFLLHRDDVYKQANAALDKVEQALRDAGATIGDVVRTRLYVTNIEQWEHIARAHRERFGMVRPCATMVEVSRLFADAAVEIEVDAVVET